MFGLWIFLLAGLPGTPNRLTLEDVGLQMDFPAAWQIKAETGPFAGLAELPPRRALAMIARERVRLGDRRGVDQLLAGLKQSFEKHRVLKNETLTLGAGLKGHLLAIQGEARGKTLRHLSFTADRFGERYTITFATLEEHYEKLEAEFTGIIKTLVIAGDKHRPQTDEFLKTIQDHPVDYGKLKNLLDAGADIDGIDHRGFSALAWAILNRQGKPVKWLLENGASAEDPRNNMSMLGMAASPPIRDLLRKHLNPATRDNQISATRHGNPKGLQIQWVSPEAQLHAGITDGRIEFVREALAKGADLSKPEANYQLPALSLTRQLISEYKELDLDPSKLEKIEALLVEAARR